MLKAHPFVLLRAPLQSLNNIDLNPDFGQTLFEEGIYLASPEFWRLARSNEEKSEKEKSKLEIAIAKYWSRSCTRCTPYGLFAGSAVLSLSEDETKLVLDNASNHIKMNRLDMNYMAGVANAITHMPIIRNQINFYPNNSLYELFDHYRYAEYTLEGNSRHYNLMSVEKSNYVKSVIDFSRRGARIQSLINLLVETEKVEISEAEEFINALIDSQLLVSEIDLCVTGMEPLDQLVKSLSRLSNISELQSKVVALQKMVKNPKPGVEYFQMLEWFMSNLGLEVNLPKNSFQVDMFLKMSSKQIDEKIISSITQQLEDTMKLARVYQSMDLVQFKEKFKVRYEENEIQLSNALDADLGLGYGNITDESFAGSAYIDNLAIKPLGNSESAMMDYVQKFIHNKFLKYLKNNDSEIVLQESELKGFSKLVEKYRYPHSMFVIGSLYKKGGQLDHNNFMFSTEVFMGPSAANLLGRFTHGSEELREQTKMALRYEEDQNPGIIYAEIAHMPESRTGNILLRPLLREYEIPYVGSSGADFDHQIPVDDLYVTVRNNEVILFSKSLQKRVMPRLSTAHNYSGKSLPIYKFLCDLQLQNIAIPNTWDWGILSNRKQLPRVTYKNIIIKKAQWKMEENDVLSLRKLSLHDLAAFDEYRKEKGIPQKVAYVETDARLLLDLSKSMGWRLLFAYIDKYKSVIVEEFLFDSENCVVTDSLKAPYTNEMIIPLYYTKGSINSMWVPKESAAISRRKFQPGSEWTYFKIYCGTKSSDKLLANELREFIFSGLEGGLFTQFFFIRYKDDFSHIRIRFYNNSPSKQLNIISRFNDFVLPLIENGIIDRVMLDTYSREIERYGDNLIELTERLFFYDSLTVMELLSLLDENINGKTRILIALRGVDSLLDDFSFSVEQKQVLLKEMQISFFNEFGGSPTLQKQLNHKCTQKEYFYCWGSL